MILVKPKLVGDFSPNDMSRFISRPGETQQLFEDFLISLHTGGDAAKGGELKILQGNLEIKEWFDGFQKIIDFILIGCGFSPSNEAEVVKTATEITAKQEVSGETITLLKQLRVDQWIRIYDKVLIIEGLWDGKGERPYILSLTEEKPNNEELETREALSG